MNTTLRAYIDLTRLQFFFAWPLLFCSGYLLATTVYGNFAVVDIVRVALIGFFGFDAGFVINDYVDRQYDKKDNFFEYYDTFSVYAALALEAVGFARKGLGWQLSAQGEIALGGRIPGATMGGLKARGFPGGATGVYQAVEATLQLQGRAGPNQIPGASSGLIQSVGGPASTVISHVLSAAR